MALDSELQEQKLREEQLKEFELLSKAKLNQSNNLDKNLITLSSASVGLIVSVLLDKNEASITILKFSLSFFVLTIVITVISFYLRIKAYEKEIAALNNEMQNISEQPKNFWLLPIEIFTVVPVISFLMGVFSLLIAYL